MPKSCTCLLPRYPFRTLGFLHYRIHVITKFHLSCRKKETLLFTIVPVEYDKLNIVYCRSLITPDDYDKLSITIYYRSLIITAT